MKRDEFGEMLKERDLLGPAVEVGVYEGEYAAQILSWGVEKLYLVDLWQHVDGGLAELDEPDWKLWAAHEKCMERLKDCLDRVIVLRGWSHEMAQFIPDHSCDFINIDATHNYEYALRDLNAYRRKLRADGRGIMAGHDYNIDEVRLAVYDFVAAHGGRVYEAPVHANDISYWIEGVNPA